MSHDSSFADLMTHLPEKAMKMLLPRSSSSSAHCLIGLARSRIDSAFRPKMDADDVVQSVFRSFFVGQSKGVFSEQEYRTVFGAY